MVLLLLREVVPVLGVEVQVLLQEVVVLGVELVLEMLPVVVRALGGQEELCLALLQRGPVHFPNRRQFVNVCT